MDQEGDTRMTQGTRDTNACMSSHYYHTQNTERGGCEDQNIFGKRVSNSLFNESVQNTTRENFNATPQPLDIANEHVAVA